MSIHVNYLNVCYSENVYERFYVNPEAYKEFYVQHRGEMGLEDAYLGMINGDEYCFKKGISENLISFPENQERIKALKTLSGYRYIDVYKHEKYAFSRKKYQMFDLHVDKNVVFLLFRAN